MENEAPTMTSCALPLCVALTELELLELRSEFLVRGVDHADADLQQRGPIGDGLAGERFPLLAVDAARKCQLLGFAFNPQVESHVGDRRVLEPLDMELALQAFRGVEGLKMREHGPSR